MNNLRNIFNEQFLVLDVGEGRLNGACFSLDREKRISVSAVFPERKWGARIPKKLIKFGRHITVAACDSSIAYTALIPVHLIRERIREPLRQIELENLLSRAVGKTINQCRKDAARGIGVDELDAVLAKSRVVNFTLDDHHVLNPIGFRAQKIEALVELTFTTRAAFEEVKRLTGGTDAFVTELAHAELSVLGKVEKDPIRLLRLGCARAPFFVREDAPIGYTVKRGELGWTTACFEDAIREAWGINAEVARKIYVEELQGRFSPHVSRFLQKLIKICSKLFLDELDGSGLKGKVFLDADMPLPFSLPLKKRGIVLNEPPLDALLERFGFTFDQGMVELPERALFGLLAPFFECFYDRGHGGLNEWLRKRLNWLGSPMADSADSNSDVPGT